VEELFEARPVKKPAFLSEVQGQVSLEDATDHKVVKIAHRAAKEEVHELPKRAKKGLKFVSKVKDGAKVSKGQVVAVIGEEERRAAGSGKAVVTDTAVKIVSEEDAIKEYIIPTDYALWVKDGDLVVPGTPLTEGSYNLFELFKLKGREVVQKYVIREIQYIYSSQGQKLNDKHIEIIVRQMFSRVYVIDSGDTDLLAGEIIEKTVATADNQEALAAKKQPATIEQLLLGITKASLTTESFLSAASFQETARVLIDAAVSGKVDYLRGLKENVIIGKLIPAGTGFRDVDDVSNIDESSVLTI
jgi:DNA-directed RNA polymerase subunit beta'